MNTRPYKPRYSPEFRSKALQRAAEIGCDRAAAELGCSRRVVFLWREYERHPERRRLPVGRPGVRSLSPDSRRLVVAFVHRLATLEGLTGPE